MKPGQRVASPRSITVEPSGTVSLGPTALMALPSMITIPSGTSASDLPSNRRAALSTIGVGCEVRSGSPAWRRNTTGRRVVSIVMGVARMGKRSGIAPTILSEIGLPYSRLRLPARETIDPATTGPFFPHFGQGRDTVFVYVFRPQGRTNSRVRDAISIRDRTG